MTTHGTAIVRRATVVGVLALAGWYPIGVAASDLPDLGPEMPPGASASGGTGLLAHGGARLTTQRLARLIAIADDPCAKSRHLVLGPGEEDPQQSPPLTSQWQACFPVQGGLTADPQIAVSTTRVVVTSQARLAFYKKSGAYVGSVAALPFFAPLGLDDGSVNAIDRYSDLRAVYDDYRGRFWIGATGINSSQADPALRRSIFAVAVSKTGNPLDGWYLYWWDAVAGYGVPASPVHEAGDAADDPFLGIDGVAIHHTNRVRKGGLDRYWRVAFFPADVLAQGTPGPISGWQYWDLTNPNGSPAWAIQPAVHHGVSPRAYYASRQGTSDVVVWSLTDALLPGQQISRVAVPVSAWNAPENAPQQGSVQLLRMKKLGTEVLKASYRNGLLHLVTTDARDWFQDGQMLTSVRLLRLNVAGYPSVSTTIDKRIGKVNTLEDGPNDHLYYGWPAIEVNATGHMAIVYARSGDPLFPEARYSTYFVNEPDIRESRVLKTGAAPYAIPGWGTPTLPWGETAGASVDPHDGEAIWIAHQYASAGGGPLGNYAIWVGKVFGNKVFDLTPLFIGDPSGRPVTDPEMPIDVQWEMVNDGDGMGETVQTAFTLVREDGLRVAVARDDRRAPLPGETFTFRDTLIVPRETPPGRYALQLILDPANRIPEYDEGNNAAISGFVITVGRAAGAAR